MENNNDLNASDILEKLIALTTQEFMNLGSDGLAYIKPLGTTDGRELFALHGADGSHIATGQDVLVLQAIAKQNDLISVGLQ